MKQSRAGTCSCCDSPILARRLCRKHYQRWYKYGDPEKIVNLPTTATSLERLEWFGWVVTETGCWEWSGYCFPNGYGRVPVGNTTRGAHCVAYEVWNGPIPKGLLVRHRCDNPPCINPNHLLTGTHQDNMQDKIDRQRQHSIVGEAHHAARLTADVVREVRRLYGEEGWTQTMLAQRFGTTNKNMFQIVHNMSWKHLLDKEVVDIESEEVTNES